MPSRLKMKQNRIRCGNCDARNGYARNTNDSSGSPSKEWVCRDCAEVTPLVKRESDGVLDIQEEKEI